MEDIMNENEKEIDLRFDALTAGIEHDGLRSKADINTIICYMVAKSKVRLTQKAVCETLVEGAIANYFEIMDAFSRIFRDKIVTEDEDGFLVPSDKCTNLIEYVEKDLPLSVREKSIKMSAKIAAKEIYAKENKVEIEEAESGYNITLHLSDNDEDFMVIKLNVPSVEEAEMIKENFLTDPAKIYNALINALLF
ncbi:MAG: DUF4364 family protein [Eubacterium sp.]|nr:DUF4364 family protein [Eubacterium sp.]